MAKEKKLLKRVVERLENTDFDSWTFTNDNSVMTYALRAGSTNITVNCKYFPYDAFAPSERTKEYSLCIEKKNQGHPEKFIYEGKAVEKLYKSINYHHNQNFGEEHKQKRISPLEGLLEALE